MAKSTIDVKIRLCWWVRPYLSAMFVFARLHGASPDVQKITRFIMKRGVRCEVDRG